MRKGWKAINPVPVTTGTWDPRNGYAHITAVGDRLVLVANGTNGQNYGRLNNADFAAVGPAGADAKPHRCDYASWDDLMWVARGTQPGFTWDGYNPVQMLSASGGVNWQNDYTNPGGGLNMPCADLISQHAGYMFVAGTHEPVSTARTASAGPTRTIRTAGPRTTSSTSPKAGSGSRR